MMEQRTYLAMRLARIAAQFRHLPRVFGLVWASSRGWSVAWVVLLALQGVVPAGQLYVVRGLVDRLGKAVVARTAVDPSHLRDMLVLAAILIATLLALEIIHGLSEWVRTVQAERLQDEITARVHERSIAADMAFYDWPEYFDLLHRARVEASYRPVALIDTLGQLFQSTISLIALGAVLVSFGPWLPAAVVACAVPALVAIVYGSYREHEWRSRATAAERRLRYYDRLLTESASAAELRLFGLGALFQGAYQELRRRLRRERLALIRAESVAEAGAGVLGLAVAGGSVGWMVWQGVKGRASLGDLALFYQAFQQGEAAVRRLLDGVGQFYANSLFLGNLFAFLDLSPRVIDPPKPLPAPAVIDSIRFRNVCFHYPGSARKALDHFDLTIPAGQIVAVVGPNGAGKSTLLKLVCRFYDPDAGSIEIDGVDLRAFRLDDLRDLITVLFQEPVRYSFTIAEAITLGRQSATISRDELESAAKAAGADEVVQRMTRGYDTLLGREVEGGVELSGGEWQRIALARAFFRNAPIILLDEPTSAMDSWAEADWMARLRSLAGRRTVVVITHRFTTAMQADVIHVLDDGRVVETGTHEELVALGGRYALSWSLQTRR